MRLFLSIGLMSNWYQQLKWGRSNIANLPRSGRQASDFNDTNARIVKAIFDRGRKMTVVAIARELNWMKNGLCSSTQQFKHEKSVCMLSSATVDTWTRANEGDVLNSSSKSVSRRTVSRSRWPKMRRGCTMVTVDETWVHHGDYNLKLPTPMKPRAQKYAENKLLLTVFWDAKGLLLKAYLPLGNTVNGQYFVDLLTKLISESSEHNLCNQRSWE